MKRLHSSTRRQHGFTLLETLVALVIFSVGLLGIVALQARSVQLSVDGEDRNRAALLADEAVAALWTSVSGSGAGACDAAMSVDAGGCAITVNLSPAAMTAWSTNVGQALPGGSGTISAPDADGIVTVSISWRPPSRATGDPDSVYTTKVVIAP
jgi:type IV pilus assembly protein PilV